MSYYSHSLPGSRHHWSSPSRPAVITQSLLPVKRSSLTGIW
jgi:hypothetical protein